MSIQRQTDKRAAVHIHGGIFFSQEGQSDTGYNMGEPEDITLNEISRSPRTHTQHKHDRLHFQEAPTVTRA